MGMVPVSTFLLVLFAFYTFGPYARPVATRTKTDAVPFEDILALLEGPLCRDIEGIVIVLVEVFKILVPVRLGHRNRNFGNRVQVIKIIWIQFLVGRLDGFEELLLSSEQATNANAESTNAQENRFTT